MFEALGNTFHWILSSLLATSIRIGELLFCLYFDRRLKPTFMKDYRNGGNWTSLSILVLHFHLLIFSACSGLLKYISSACRADWESFCRLGFELGFGEPINFNMLRVHWTIIFMISLSCLEQCNSTKKWPTNASPSTSWSITRVPLCRAWRHICKSKPVLLINRY